MASHVLRLYLECNELLSTGKITLPLKENQLVLTVKRGEWSKERFLEEAHRLEALCDILYPNSVLPHSPNFDKADTLLVSLVKKYHGYGVSKESSDFRKAVGGALRALASSIDKR